MHSLEWAEVVLTVGGVFLLGASLAAWQVRGAPRLLRDAPIRPNALSPQMVWFSLLGCMWGGMVGYTLARFVVSESLPEPIREAWRAVIVAIGMELLTMAVCLAVAWVAFVDRWRGWGLRVGSARSEVLWVVWGWLVGVGLCSLVAWWTSRLIDAFLPEMERPTHTVFVALGAPEAGTMIRLVTFLSAAMLAPVSEEFFFRGIIQSALVKMIPAHPRSSLPRWCAIGMTSVLFGLMHFGTPQYVPALIVFGVILGFLYEKRGSLVTPILVHILFNVKSLLWFFLQS